MRTLHPALLAAQRSATARPYLRVEVVEKVGAAARFTWSRLYSGAEPDCHHDAAMAGDGSLVRLRGGGGIYRQRVEEPGPGSDLSLWYYWGFTGSDVALCSHGAEVLAFWVQSSGWLLRRESATCGETWGDTIHMSYIGGDYAGYRVAACHRAGGDALVLYSNGATLYRRRRTSGTWEAAAAWSNTLASITGIACHHSGDWNVVVTGVDGAGRAGVWSCVLGDGYTMPAGTWSGLQDITLASPGSHITYHAPSLDRPDVYRAFFVEQYDGVEAYARPCWTHSLPGADFISNLWREPVPFNLACQYGVALTGGGPHAWLCAPYGVWRCATTPAAVDVTGDTVAVSTEIRPYSGRLLLTMRNDDRRFNAIGPGHPINKGSRVLLHLGYHTAEGPKSSAAPAFWVEGWEHATGAGRSHLTLHAGDGWSLLRRWRAGRQFTWQKGERNIFQLLRFFFARAGLEFSALSYSGAVFQCPAFTVHPGESALTAVRRLLDMVPDAVLFAGDTACLVHPRAGDAGSYSYGEPHSESGHPIIEGAYTTGARAVNRARVFGDGLFTEDWDWDEIEAVYDRAAQASDLNLATTDEAHQRGQAMLRQAEIEAMSGHMVVPMNCGQELLDVITVTSAQAGLEGARRRVMALHHTGTPPRGRYRLRMELGAP